MLEEEFESYEEPEVYNMNQLEEEEQTSEVLDDSIEDTELYDPQAEIEDDFYEPEEEFDNSDYYPETLVEEQDVGAETAVAASSSFNDEPRERKNLIDAAADAEEKVGEKIERVGQTIEHKGQSLENTGENVEKAGKAMEKSGHAMQKTGLALDAVGKTLNEAGAALDSSGYGAAAGVVLNAAGTAMSATGQSVNKAGVSTEQAGKATKETGKNIKRQGKEIKQKGKDIKQQGKNIKQNAANMRKYGKHGKQQYQHTKVGVAGLNNKTNNNLTSQAKSKIDDKIKATLKNPSNWKYLIPIILILGVVLAFLLVVVIIFTNEDEGATSGGGSGSYAYGQTCTKVTVINTGCDENNQMCTNQYNGDVETEDYIAGVVAAESNGNTNPEYLKLLAVAARTNFISNVDDDCTVEGNSNFQKYIDVNASSNIAEILEAVQTTKNYIAIVDDDVIEINYGYGIVDSEDTTNYYISYGKNTSEAKSTQVIPKSWVSNQTMFTEYLNNWQTSNESATELSLIGALYLITNESYTYQGVIKYYYGETINVSENTMILSGINGYMNPTRTINCTSAFGNRIHPVDNTPQFHGGLDIGIAGGEPIYAAKNGIVSVVVSDVSVINDCSYGYGNYVIIDHGDGTKTLYSHMKYGSVPSNIYVGAEINQGQQVGEVGSTGCSTGNHLHYEVRVNDEQVDPADYLDLTNAQGTCRN